MEAEQESFRQPALLLLILLLQSAIISAIGWSGERQTIAPMDTSSYRYFVRVDGNCEENRNKAESVFGKAEFTVLDDLDEFAFVTEKMTEAAFKEKAAELDQACRASGKKGILQMIRAEL